MKLLGLKKTPPKGSLIKWQSLILLSLSFALVSCFVQQSYIGRTTVPRHVLSMSGDSVERVWQTDEIILSYQVNGKEGDDPFSISGNLSIQDWITRSFPTVKKLLLRIHYLNEDNQVISTHPIGVNYGYKKKRTKNLKLIDVHDPPTDAVAFTFSYFGIMSGFSNADANTGDWEIYFDPFEDPNGSDQPTNDLFYQE